MIGTSLALSDGRWILTRLSTGMEVVVRQPSRLVVAGSGIPSLLTLLTKSAMIILLTFLHTLRSTVDLWLSIMGLGISHFPQANVVNAKHMTTVTGHSGMDGRVSYHPFRNND